MPSKEANKSKKNLFLFAKMADRYGDIKKSQFYLKKKGSEPVVSAVAFQVLISCQQIVDLWVYCVLKNWFE